MKLQLIQMLVSLFSHPLQLYIDYKTLFKETDKTKPINNYGSSKLKFEKYLNYNKKVSHVILRFFNVTGNYYIKGININKNDSVILKLYKTYKKQKKLFYIASIKKNSTRRDFIHIKDLINIIEKTIYNKKKFLTLNCGYGKSISIFKIINEFEKNINIHLKKFIKLKNQVIPLK